MKYSAGLKSSFISEVKVPLPRTKNQKHCRKKKIYTALIQIDKKIQSSYIGVWVLWQQFQLLWPYCLNILFSCLILVCITKEKSFLLLLILNQLQVILWFKVYCRIILIRLWKYPFGNQKWLKRTVWNIIYYWNNLIKIFLNQLC